MPAPAIHGSLLLRAEHPPSEPVDAGQDRVAVSFVDVCGGAANQTSQDQIGREQSERRKQRESDRRHRGESRRNRADVSGLRQPAFDLGFRDVHDRHAADVPQALQKREIAANADGESRRRFRPAAGMALPKSSGRDRNRRIHRCPGSSV